MQIDRLNAKIIGFLFVRHNVNLALNRAKINISARSIAAININGLACAKVRCEIPADFRHRRKAEISNWPANAVRARRFAPGG
jgi:hypothetical protein